MRRGATRLVDFESEIQHKGRVDVETSAANEGYY